jgi:hypothetical protein
MKEHYLTHLQDWACCCLVVQVLLSKQGAAEPACRQVQSKLQVKLHENPNARDR